MSDSRHIRDGIYLQIEAERLKHERNGKRFAAPPVKDRWEMRERLVKNAAAAVAKIESLDAA